MLSCRSAEDDRSPSRRWVDPDKAGPDTRSGGQLGRPRAPTLPVVREIDVGRTPAPAAVGALKQMDALFSAGMAIGNSQVQVTSFVSHELRPPRKLRPDRELERWRPSGPAILRSPIADPELTS